MSIFITVNGSDYYTNTLAALSLAAKYKARFANEKLFDDLPMAENYVLANGLINRSGDVVIPIYLALQNQDCTQAIKKYRKDNNPMKMLYVSPTLDDLLKAVEEKIKF